MIAIMDSRIHGRNRDSTVSTSAMRQRGAQSDRVTERSLRPLESAAHLDLLPARSGGVARAPGREPVPAGHELDDGQHRDPGEQPPPRHRRSIAVDPLSERRARARSPRSRPKRRPPATRAKAGRRGMAPPPRRTGSTRAGRQAPTRWDPSRRRPGAATKPVPLAADQGTRTRTSIQIGTKQIDEQPQDHCDPRAATSSERPAPTATARSTSARTQGSKSSNPPPYD